jgi:hypothetical protein
MPATEEQDRWVAAVLGVNPPVRRAPPATARGEGEGAGGTPPRQRPGEGASTLRGASGSGPAPPPPVALRLTTETEARSPTDRARTKLGVGENVTLQVAPGPGQWTTSGGRLSTRMGSKVTLTAPGRPGTVDVTVTAKGESATVRFTVVAPSRVAMTRLSTEHYDIGVPNAGMRTQIYVGPDDVNFGNITFTEDECGAAGSGSWSAKNGEGHSPNPDPLGFFDQVVPNKGTKAAATDHCWSGYVPALQTAPLTDWTGRLSWPIVWRWQCGSGHGVIATVEQRVDTEPDGTTTISKAGASYKAPLT